MRPRTPHRAVGCPRPGVGCDGKGSGRHAGSLGSNVDASAHGRGEKSRGGWISRPRARDPGSGAEGTRPRTCACCRLEFTTLPYSSSEYSNSESPISPEAPRDLAPRARSSYFSVDVPSEEASPSGFVRSEKIGGGAVTTQESSAVDVGGSCSRLPGGPMPRRRTAGSVDRGRPAPRRRGALTTPEPHRENGTRRGR